MELSCRGLHLVKGTQRLEWWGRLFRAFSILLLVLVAVCLEGCGGSDPGRGTQSLYVEAHVTSDEAGATRVRVQVRDGDGRGRIEEAAVVRVRGHEEGEWVLDFEGRDWGPFAGGFHLLEGLEWQRGWHLEVEVGEEHWLEAYLEMPGLCTIIEPAADVTYRRGDGFPLVARWEDSQRRHSRSIQVELNRNDYSVRLPGDVFRHEIASSVFRRDGGERLTVQRWNEVELLGGTIGSSFRGATFCSVDFRVD